MSSKLDAPRRALTAALNARLTPQIRHLIEALSRVLADEAIDAPLMIVKGDGSLMKAEIALEYPVETILSGPAASVVGAGFLTGLDDFVVSDMGGTTTDIAVVCGGRPVDQRRGRAGRRLAHHGRGGRCAHQRTRRRQRSALRPPSCGCASVRARPCRSACWRTAGRPCSRSSRNWRCSSAFRRMPAQFAFRNPDRSLPLHLSALERRVWDALDLRRGRCPMSRAAAPASRRCGVSPTPELATLAAFTPSDAMHVLDRQQGWCREAAECGARILATEERNARAARAAVSAQAICERTYEHVVRETGRVLLAAALARDPKLEARGRGWGALGDRLIEEIVAGRRFSQLLHATLALAQPLIAIGAPVGAYYPEVARRLGAALRIPEHAAVCNAVGAVAGVVSQTVEILVNQPTFKVFRVHDPAGSRDYADAEPALEHAKRVAGELALAAARRAGAADPHVETSVAEKLAHVGPGADYLAEAVARSTATGRPLAGAPSRHAAP